MKFYQPMIVVLFFVWFLINPLHAQSEPRSLYLQVSNETTDSVSLLDLSTGENETIYSVSQQIKGVNLDIFPQDEIDALNAFRPEYEKITGRVMGRLEDALVRARIDSLIVSPNNSNAVAEVIYTTCLNPLYNTCFGTTHLVLIDRLNKSQRLVLNIGRHADDYLPTSANLVDFRVSSVQWMPDQEEIIVGIKNVESHQQPVRSAIVIVPTSGMQPYKVSEGTVWTTNPTGNQIVVLAGEEIALSYVNVLKLIDLDINSGRFSEQQYSLRPYAIYDTAGLVFFNQFPMFSIAFDNSLGESTLPSGGLTIFDTQTTTSTIMLPNPEGNVSRLDSTPDGRVTVAQMPDGTLSRILIVGTTMELQPITSASVASWNLSSNGELLVQFAGDNTYQMLDAQGNIKQSFDLSQAMRSAASEETQIIAVDW